MNTSKLKGFLLAACCLVLALLVKSQAMDDSSDSQEIKLWIGHSESYLDNLKPETDNSSLHVKLTLNQEEDEKSTASWGSYVTSPIKAVIHGTYNIADFAVKHPNQTIVTSLLIAAQLAAVAADAANNDINISLFGYEIIRVGVPCIRIGEIPGWVSVVRICPN